MADGSDLMTPHAAIQDVSTTGLVIREGISRDDWRDIGGRLGRMNGAMLWFVGDWLAYGERKWGEMYDEAEKLTGYAYGTLSTAARMSSRFQFRLRRRNLTYSHHTVVISLSDDEAVRLLEIAERDHLSFREFRALVAQERSLPAVAEVDGDELQTSMINGGLKRLIRADAREVIEKTFITLKVLGGIFASIKTRPENTEQIIDQLLEVEKQLRREIVRLKEMTV